MGDILYGILFNVTMLSMTTVPFMGIILIYKWTMFSMYERPYLVYPEDKKHYAVLVIEENKKSIKEWGMDRFAYCTYILAKYMDHPQLQVKRTKLPDKEWLEIIHQDLRQVWREFGNPTVSPGYPEVEVDISNRVYEIT